ncbi:MAG: AAA family ATPase [Leptospirales bacterium]|nr:AAA family ATPase [Leptospirales bacterium]
MPPWLSALLQTSGAVGGAGAALLHETHISWVLLSGDHAYKFKKPVRFDFADFSTLQLRRYFCEEELRLNSRSTPQLYQGIIAVVGSASSPQIVDVATANESEVLEYGLRMARFEESQSLDQLEARGELSDAQVEEIADACWALHRTAAQAGPQTPYGSVAQTAQFAEANFSAVDGKAPELSVRLERLHHWSQRTLQELAPVLEERKRAGAVRECHGDLHLANMALFQGKVALFDCIEFSAELRWIDVCSDIAFAIMDFCARGRRDHAWRFANRYLELSGDYEGAAVLRFFLCYRAMVRALVAALRLTQTASEAQHRINGADLRRYESLAMELAEERRPILILTCGLSGSGKSRATRELFDAGVIRVRSDVERKRLHGLAPEANSYSAMDSGIYASDSSERTYQRLLDLARALLRAGFPTIVDATFLESRRRQTFADLAAAEGAAFLILHCNASAATLRARVQRRIEKGKNASEADLEVLEAQLQRGYQFSESEEQFLITLDTENEDQRATGLDEVRRRISSADRKAAR